MFAAYRICSHPLPMHGGHEGRQQQRAISGHVALVDTAALPGAGLGPTRRPSTEVACRLGVGVGTLHSPEGVKRCGSCDGGMGHVKCCPTGLGRDARSTL